MRHETNSANNPRDFSSEMMRHLLYFVLILTSKVPFSKQSLDALQFSIGKWLPCPQALADRTTHYINSLHDVLCCALFARLCRNRVLHVNCLCNASFYQQAPGNEAGVLYSGENNVRGVTPSSISTAGKLKSMGINLREVSPHSKGRRFDSCRG